MGKQKYKQYEKVLNREEVVEILKESKVVINSDLSRIDLSRLDLSGCVFSGCRFDYGWLKNSKFDGAIIRGATFRNAMLDYTSFQGVDARNSKFAGCHLKGSNFNRADVRYGSFVRATIIETPFNFANLYRANLAGVYIQRSSIRNANLSNLRGWRMWIVGSDLSSTKFNSAVLRGTAFEASNLSECTWDDADLRRSQIITSKYEYDALSKANLKGANIMRSGESISVFISHASEDKIFAKRLAKDLQASGVDAWLDVWNIRVGDSISEKIMQALEKCHFVVVILSETFFNKGWPMRELKSAIMKQSTQGNNYILPVKIDDASIPDLIADIAYADFREDYELAFEQLIQGIFEE